MLSPEFLFAKFNQGLSYERYVHAGTPAQVENWERFDRVARDHAALDSHQRAALADFCRRINILVISGLWCGDCVAQCPLLAIIADHRPDLIDVRFLDRDQNLDIAEQVKICGGLRVPTAIFMNEDFDFVSLYGDKSLARLRALAAKSLGAACPLPTTEVPHDEIRATMADWLQEVERVHLILRLSPKLRQKHGD
jgi:thiol-disulfide isomerase/thioredoxin